MAAVDLPVADAMAFIDQTKRRSGREALATTTKTSTDRADSNPRIELGFKIVRQATPKIIGISAPGAAVLDGHFEVTDAADV